MTRIDEALRRAAGQTTDGAATTDPAAGTPAPADAAVLAREPFPFEVDEPDAGPEVAAADLLSPEEPAPDGTGDAAGPEGPESGRPPLFDRIDHRLVEKVVADDNMAPASREQYRKLAAVLHEAKLDAGTSVLMVASAVPGEGKTLTAVNLALTLSESYGQRVLLIDADLRKPALHELFQLNAATGGLSDGLNGSGTGGLVVRQVSPWLSVLPAGRPMRDPMAALTSPRMRQLVDEARGTFDWVIIDTPPLVLMPDAHLLSSMADGTLLVIRANSTPHDLVKRATDIVGRERITGVVLNRATTGQSGYGDYYARGYYNLPVKTRARP